jgi:hypothetical protein
MLPPIHHRNVVNNSKSFIKPKICLTVGCGVPITKVSKHCKSCAKKLIGAKVRADRYQGLVIRLANTVANVKLALAFAPEGNYRNISRQVDIIESELAALANDLMIATLNN